MTVRTTSTLLAILGPALSMALATPASAQSVGPRPTQDPEALPDGKRPEAPFTVTGTVAVVTDYRFRGVSLSNNDPAVQAGVEVATRSGVYAGAWGSTIPEYSGAHAEVDGYAGYRHAVSGWQLDLGAIGYFYPSGRDVNGFELYGSVSREVAGATVKAGASYTPHQRNFGSGDGTYLFGEATAALPGTPLTLRGHFGREAGVSGGPDGDKIDWLVGVDAAVGPATASLAWVDTDVAPRAGGKAYRSALVGSLGIGF